MENVSPEFVAMACNFISANGDAARFESNQRALNVPTIIPIPTSSPTAKPPANIHFEPCRRDRVIDQFLARKREGWEATSIVIVSRIAGYINAHYDDRKGVTR
jgi:hypothetical protein